MSYARTDHRAAAGERDGASAPAERLSLGVAARLSRYLQVLTQAKKMGKETISSQELSDYTHVNSTQIRRDLSGFGKFGKRGVGYNVEALVSQIRKILRTAGQHNIALIGAGHLGNAIASSEIFADHGFRVVAIFDNDRGQGRQRGRRQTVRHIDELRQVVEDEDIVVGVLAVPTRRPGPRRRARRGGREDHLQLLGVAARRAAGGDRPHLQPRRRSALRAVLLSDLSRPGIRRPSDEQPGSRPRRRDVRRRRGPHRRARGGVLDPRPARRSTWRRASRSCATAAERDPLLHEHITGELISSEIEIISGRRRGPARRARAPARAPQARCSRWPAPTARRSARPARTRGRTTASSRSSTPSTTTASRTASSTSPGATTPSACTCTSASTTSTAPCASATACAPCCRCCSRSPRTRRSSTAATAGLHSARTQTFTQELPALRRPRRLRRLGRLSRVHRVPDPHAARSSSSRRCGGRCGRTSASARSRCASATRRRPRRSPTRWPALMVACIAQAMRDVDEGVPFADPRRG